LRERETMDPPAADELYVGYLKQAPPALARFGRRVILGLLALTAALAALVVSRQAPFDPGSFEFGVARPFTGVVIERPYPALWVGWPTPRGGATTGGAIGEGSRYDLVATGKHGAAEQVEGLDGERVHLEGTLIRREGRVMIEVVPGSVVVQGGEEGRESSGPRRDLGEVTVRGEIVDSKCYLGVMKPGRGKPHRSCASLCIRGGIPPVLAVESRDGRRANLLLVDEDGRMVNDRVLDRVAEPVEITGRLYRYGGGVLVLAANPDDYLRLNGPLRLN